MPRGGKQAGAGSKPGRAPTAATRKGNGAGWGGAASRKPAKAASGDRQPYQDGNPGGPGCVATERSLERRAKLQAYAAVLFDAFLRGQNLTDEQREDIRRQGAAAVEYKLFEMMVQEHPLEPGDKVRVMAGERLHQIWTQRKNVFGFDENGAPVTDYAVTPEHAESMEAWTASAKSRAQQDEKSGAHSPDLKPSS